MSQAHYLKSVLQRFGMNDCKPRTTPCESKMEVNTSSNKEDTIINEDKSTTKYREIVGSLVYVMTCTRPDLTWIITRLSQHLANPTEVD